jgi:ureidoacrylate peracid hydrolase
MKPALIVIDCQNDFIKDSSSYYIKDPSDYFCQMLDSKLIGRIKQLIEFCRNKKIPVIFTQHSIKPDKSNAEVDEPKDFKACIIGTKGWKIIKGLEPKKGELIVRKDRFDAFYNTSLEKILKKLKIDSVILCGVLTNNCVRATAEGAYYRNFRLILVSDCCGGTSYLPDKKHEEIHDITLRDLKERTYDTKLVSLKELKNNIL